MNTVVFYHGTDNDGFCSGALVKLKLPSTTLYPVTHSVFKKGEIEYLKNKVKKNDTVFVCDFSFSPEGFHFLIKDLNCNVIWLDHHISSIQKVKESSLLQDIHIQGIRDINFSGCELTWKYLFSDQKMNQVVKLLGRYDVWDHSDDDTLLFQNGISQYDVNPIKDMSIWNLLIPTSDNPLLLKYSEKAFKDIIEEGRVITRYSNTQNRIKCYSAFSCSFKEEQFKDYKMIGVFGGHGSLTFSSIWDKNKYDIMFTTNFNGEDWYCSLYTDKEDVDVSKIASFFGGGGHKGASGMILLDVFSVVNFHGKLSNINKNQE